MNFLLRLSDGQRTKSLDLRAASVEHALMMVIQTIDPLVQQVSDMFSNHVVYWQA
jgi:hypothetical protein